MRRVALVLATAGGAGLTPVAPGTAGSVVGVVIYWLTRHWEPITQILLVIVLSATGIWASSVAADHFQREDPGQVVIDEVAGQMVTLLLLDAGVVGVLVGFVVFRVFDIVKPWPVRSLEALPAGFGIMADDLAAGALGWITMRLLFLLVQGAT